MLPNVEGNNMSIQNGKPSEPFSTSGSFLDAKSQSGAGGQQPLINTTSDILFLKRLLFLKAALDND